MGLILLVIAASIYASLCIHSESLVGTVLYCAPILWPVTSPQCWRVELCFATPGGIRFYYPTLFNSTGISMLSGNVPSDHASGLGASKKATVQNRSEVVTKLL